PAQIRPFVELVPDRVARTAFPVAARIAVLHDEVGHDAVDAQPIEEPLAGERDEALDGERRVEDRQLDLNRAAIGVDVYLGRYARVQEARGLICLARDGRRRRTDADISVARRIERLQERRGTYAHGPVLVVQRGGESLFGRVAVLRERRKRGRSRDV